MKRWVRQGTTDRNPKVKRDGTLSTIEATWGQPGMEGTSERVVRGVRGILPEQGPGATGADEARARCGDDEGVVRRQ